MKLQNIKIEHLGTIKYIAVESVGMRHVVQAQIRHLSPDEFLQMLNINIKPHIDYS